MSVKRLHANNLEDTTGNDQVLAIVKQLECVRSTMIACHRHCLRHRSQSPCYIFCMMAFHSFAFALIQQICVGIDMATPVTIASSTSASKRARSQDCNCLSNNFPATGTTGKIEASYRPHIPAFLRQSRSGPLIAEQLCAC